MLLAALELTGGRLISCDTEPIEGLCARIPHLREAAQSARWSFRNLESSQVLRGLGTEAFELVLHDGSHEADQVEEDIAGILPRLKRYGILLVHDVEQFALGPQVRRGLASGIRRSRLRVSMTSLPYSDGLAIVRMEDDTGRGQVASAWCKSTTRPAVAAPMPW